MALDASDPNAIRQAARDILNQTQFTSQEPSRWDRAVFYLTHPLDFLSMVINWVLNKFFVTAGNAVVAGVLAAIIAAVVIFMVVRFSTTATRNSSVRIHYAPQLGGKSWKEFFREAEAKEAEGQWRDAIRLRYSAVLLQLGEQGIVRVRDGRTTGEYAREVTSGAPAIAEAFGQITRTFEWVWYGDGEPTADDVAEFESVAATTQKAAA